MQTKICKICQHEFSRPKDVGTKFWDARKYCGRECFNISMKGKLPKNIVQLNANKKGENNPAWKGGITTKTYGLRRGADLKQWRREIYERDKYQCMKCHVISGFLCAHHVLNWEEHKELRFNISNGITLCRKCHIGFHRRYGYKRNTKEHIEHFFADRGFPFHATSVQRILNRISMCYKSAV